MSKFLVLRTSIHTFFARLGTIGVALCVAAVLLGALFSAQIVSGNLLGARHLLAGDPDPVPWFKSVDNPQPSPWHKLAGDPVPVPWFKSVDNPNPSPWLKLTDNPNPQPRL